MGMGKAGFARGTELIYDQISVKCLMNWLNGSTTTNGHQIAVGFLLPVSLEVTGDGWWWARGPPYPSSDFPSTQVGRSDLPTNPTSIRRIYIAMECIPTTPSRPIPFSPHRYNGEVCLPHLDEPGPRKARRAQ